MDSSTTTDYFEAIKFVNEEDNDELWKELLKHCINKPEMLAPLLERSRGHLDPHYIVDMVKDMEIVGLRDSLLKIIKDYKTEISLKHECLNMLKTKSVGLQSKHYKGARRAMYISNENKRRCCMCADILSTEDLYVFSCCHAYHKKCLVDSIASSSSEKKTAAHPSQDAPQYNTYAEEDDGDDHSRIRCILCDR